MGECCSGQSWTVRLLATGQSRNFARFAVPRHLTLWLAAVFLTVMRAAVCVADFDMTGTWNVGAGTSAVNVLQIVQTGTSLAISVTSSMPPESGTGTIDPVTGAATCFEAEGR